MHPAVLRVLIRVVVWPSADLGHPRMCQRVVELDVILVSRHSEAPVQDGLCIQVGDREAIAEQVFPGLAEGNVEGVHGALQLVPQFRGPRLLAGLVLHHLGEHQQHNVLFGFESPPDGPLRAQRVLGRVLGSQFTRVFFAQVNVDSRGVE